MVLHVSHRPPASASGLIIGDYILWSWSLNGNHYVIALISGLTLPPLAIVWLWLLALSLARLAAFLLRGGVSDLLARGRTAGTAAWSGASALTAPVLSPIAGLRTSAGLRLAAARAARDSAAAESLLIAEARATRAARAGRVAREALSAREARTARERGYTAPSPRKLAA
jgi:hypothetical protein